MLIVGVTGKAQHGKDTLGAHLTATRGFRRYAFADGVREAALAVNPWLRAEGGTFERLADYVAGVGGWDIAKRHIEVRRVLQVLGTEAVRDVVGEDAWVLALAKRLREDDPERVVITDVRFENEAAWVREHGGVVVKVVRVNADGSPFDNGLDSGHVSESGVDNIRADIALVNDGTVNFLHRIDNVWAHLDEMPEPVRIALWPQAATRTLGSDIEAEIHTAYEAESEAAAIARRYE